MLYTIGIAVTFFLSFILLTKNEKSKADQILALWLTVIGIHLTLYYIISTKNYFQLPDVLGFEIPMPLLHGPFIFLYTTSLTHPNDIGKKGFLHFIPYFLGLLALGPFFVLSPEKKVMVYQQEGSSFTILMNIFFLCIILSGIIYSSLSLRSLIAHKKKILKSYSYIEKVNLKWLYYLIIGMGGIWLVVIFGDDHYIFSSVVLYVMFIGYYGIKQVGVFTDTPAIENLLALEASKELFKETPVPEERPKYEKSELTFNQLETIHQDLVLLMQHEKLYKTPELTISDVAKKLSIHPNILSQVINRMEEKNFFDYINSKRVDEFRELVSRQENQQFTLLAIAYECGFNSKTSFNRNFKKVAGISPSEYLKEARIKLNQ